MDHRFIIHICRDGHQFFFDPLDQSTSSSTFAPSSSTQEKLCLVSRIPRLIELDFESPLFYDPDIPNLG